MSIVYLKGREAPKAARSAMETLIFSREEINAWKLPAFQRELRINAKVMAIADAMKEEGGTIPGVLTLGRIGADKSFYIVDGQHRVEAFKLSGLMECIADVRIITFSSMADMANEFVELNSRLVNMKPDDILRGLEDSMPALRKIREGCPFVTYGHVRRGSGCSALIGMASLLRCWNMSSPEVPVASAPPAPTLAAALDNNEADKLIVFMSVARAAWGEDPENYRLWNTLNLTITMWLWRRLVLDRERGVKRAVVMTPDSFRKCLMSVSAESSYLDWLVGRNLNERDRSPCYMRLKVIFTKRLQEDSNKKVLLIAPSWASR